MIQPRASFANRLAQLSAKTSLAFCACLIWLVPFDAFRNIEMQGLILIIAGFFALLAIILNPAQYLQQLSKFELALLLIFVLSCLLSLALNPNKTYGALGAPYIRLGALGLISCVACALVVRKIPTNNILCFVYGSIVLTSLIALPYSLLRFESLTRPGSIFAQANVFACFLGVAILVGFHFWRTYPKYRRFILVSQLWLVSTMLLSQTRAVIYLVIALLIVDRLITYRSKKSRGILLLVILPLVLIGLSLLPGRLGDTPYAASSISYRLNLQKEAALSALQRPVLGYGPGNLADALSCAKLHHPSLQQTCHEGYFFNSSHNIFLDRILALGLVGGLAFLIFCIYRIWRLMLNPSLRLIAFAALLIVGYYLSNVTSVTLELLFWVLLLVNSRRPVDNLKLTA